MVDRPIVLVVEDQAPIRKLARVILEGAGYEVHEAVNGKDGLAALQDIRPLALLIADIDMPEMSGDEMVRRVRGDWPDLKVLYVTAQIDQLLDARRLWEGEAFLEKPFTPQGLTEAVSLLLHGTIHVDRQRTRVG